MSNSSETTVGRRSNQLLSALSLLTLTAAYTPVTQAGATFKIDDTKWISVGLGLRSSFQSVEGAAGNNGDKWSNDFNLDNTELAAIAIVTAMKGLEIPLIKYNNKLNLEERIDHLLNILFFGIIKR